MKIPQRGRSGRELLSARFAVDLIGAGVVLLMLVLWGVTRFTSEQDQEARRPEMPSKITSEAERRLYLQPGGRYTVEDIEANGRVTASRKFAAFVPKHDLNPQPGDALCPITRTKANPRCAWIIGGQRYEFCCPPCIDEFLQLAKDKPEKIQDPAYYVSDS